MIRDRQREAIKKFCQSYPVTVVGLPVKDKIEIRWKVGTVEHSLAAAGVSPDDLMCKIPSVERWWTAAEKEDRRNAGPETT